MSDAKRSHHAALESVARSLRLNRTKTSREFVEVVAPTPAQVQHMQMTVIPARRLYYDGGAPASLQALVKYVNTQLVQSGHPSDDRSALICLTLLAPYAASGGQDVLERASELLQRVVDADCFMTYLLPVDAKWQVRFGRFDFGPVDYAAFRERSRAAGSDYHERWGGRELRGIPFHKMLALTRMPVSCRVLDLQRPPAFLQRHPLIYELADHYYNHFASLEWKRFWMHLVEDQDLLVAFGAEPINTQTLRALPLAQSVCIFGNISGETRGWVAPGVTAVSYEVGHGIPEGLPDVLRASYGIELPLLETTPFTEPLKTFARFIRRAKIHRQMGHEDEAFLHLIIALELLFGDKSEVSKSVRDRVSVATYLRASSDFDEQQKRVARLYGIRSKYVHSGTSVPSSAYQEALALTELVAISLVEARRTFNSGYEQWLLQLDHLVAGLRAGVPTDATRVSQLGLG